MHYWIEQATVTAIGLAADNNDVTLGYYPYADWHKDQDKFDYPPPEFVHPEGDAGSSTNDQDRVIPFKPRVVHVLPKAVQDAVNEVTVFDTQYTLQIEDVDTGLPNLSIPLQTQP